MLGHVIGTGRLPFFFLVGIGGIVDTDRALKINYGDQLKRRFLKNLEEFTESDGSILPIRSELIGFTVCQFLPPSSSTMHKER
jgi:hypothetical protein